MTRGGAYVHHRYGKAGGTARVTGRGGIQRDTSTDKTMSDKLRYNETRFTGEKNALYGETGETFSDYREAWEEVRRGASEVAASNVRGRSRGQAYVYDTTLNAGDGRQPHERLHAVARDYLDELRARGYRVQGVAYAIHDNGKHTHIHMMYSTHKTIQRADSAAMRQHVRQAADRAREQHQAQARDDHDRGRG